MSRRLGPCCLQVPGENAPTVGCHPKLRMPPRDSIIPLGGRRRAFPGQTWSRYASQTLRRGLHVTAKITPLWEELGSG
jgi:hypothetical protein